MFVSQRKYDEAIKQRNEAAGVAQQLHMEKATLLLFTGLLLKKAGGQATFTQEELEKADGQFALSQNDKGDVSLEIVVKPIAPIVRRLSDEEAEKTGVIASITPAE